MLRMTLIWGVLLLAGTSMVEIYATSPMSVPVQSSSMALTSSNSSQTSPPTSPKATHKTSNQTTQTTPAPTNTTTPAPTNTTTPAPTNTTTPAPTNTTTPAPTNTTTPAPTNTTTPAPKNITTHAPSTTQPTTTPVLPTKPSPPTSGDYKVTDRNQTCVIADMGLALELGNSTTLLQASKAKGIWYFNVNPKNTTATGTCGDTNATLHLEFPQGFIHFVFVKEKKIYYIDEVSVNFSWSSTEHWNGKAEKLKLLSTDVGYSVKCKNTPMVNLTRNLQLTMADVKLQAFGISSGAFGKEEACYPDRNKMLVPVGIALAVVGLILIIILVVLLTRRRRSSGYERI